MNKIKTLIKGPLLLQSGYSVHCRQIFRALYQDPAFDLYVENTRWGSCPTILSKNDELEVIRKHVVKYDALKAQNPDQQPIFDLFIHITVPNEWEKLGKVNIGITAGAEVHKISHVWVQKINEMDLVIVPSNFTKKVFENTVVDWHNSNTGESGTFKAETPIIVCSEGVDPNIFKSFDLANNDAASKFYEKFGLNFESDFNFLHVGQWGRGGYGEDRKDIARLIKFFIEEFYTRKDVGLVLKINMASNNALDYEMTLGRLNQIKQNYEADKIPPIYLVHGELTDEEMSYLYNHPKINSFVSFGVEGFGLPLLEAAMCELPIIAINWSGHLDFLEKGKFSAVEYDMVEIPEVAVWEPILTKGSAWARVKEEDARRRLKKMVSSYYKPKEWAKELGQKLREEFSLQSTGEFLLDVVRQCVLSHQKERMLSPSEYLESLVDTPEDFNILFTMPRSNGDVFISSAIVNGLMKQVKEQQPNAKLYFATQPQYAAILEGNPDIYKVVGWKEYMLDVSLGEEVFDLVLTPDTATQYKFSNYIKRGAGKTLAETYAEHCGCQLGDYFIKEDKSVCEELLKDKVYMTLHAGSGKGQWEARRFADFSEIVRNLKMCVEGLTIVQVGSPDDMEVEGVDVDLRGKTSVHQLASVVKGSALHLGIDSFPNHLSAHFMTPLVSLYGSSYASVSRPWYKDHEKSKYILLETENRMGCERACYKDTCKVNKAMPCVNNVDPKNVFEACVKLLMDGKNNA